MEFGDQLQDELRHTAAPLPNVPLSDTVRNANFAAAPIAIDRNAESTVVAGYFQDQVGLADHWKAVVGARLDRFGVSVDDHLPTGSDFHARTRSQPARGPDLSTHRPRVHLRQPQLYLPPSGQTLGLTPTTAQVGPEEREELRSRREAGRTEQASGVAAAAVPARSRRREEYGPTDPTRVVLTGQQRTDGASITARRPSHAPTGSCTAATRPRAARITIRHHRGARRAEDRSRVPETSSRCGHLRLPSRSGRRRRRDRASQGVHVVQQSGGCPRYTRVDAVVTTRIGHPAGMNAENLFNTTYYPTANGDNNIIPGRHAVRCRCARPSSPKSLVSSP